MLIPQIKSYLFHGLENRCLQNRTIRFPSVKFPNLRKNSQTIQLPGPLLT
jgi:hypothetical protein